MNKTEFEKRIERKKKTTIFMVLIFILVIAAIITFNTDIFSVNRIEVSGHKILTKDSIVYTSGITLGNNIFRERIRTIEENLIQHPYIKKANAKRILPNKIKIDIEERKRYAAIPFVENYIIIDNEGYVLETLQDHENLVLVKGLDFDNFNEGDVLSVKDKQQMGILVEIISAIEIQGLSVMEIDLTNTDDIRINISNQLTSIIGNADNLSYKFMVMSSILEDLAMKGISRGVIDISHEGYPSYRPVE
ncbi:MAG: FtsQ-type POTRA domain-containing protein [Alkaliphilus sp.]|nr:FtsQ-type POTRA domain-containing protein [Alkaliphilus sp.]